MTLNLFKKCIAELIGTFSIVFLGCGAVVTMGLIPDSVDNLGVSLVFGFVVMVMIYTFGHISGAHFNPAVTIAFAVRRHFPSKDIVYYIVFQCMGAVLASLIHLSLLIYLKNFYIELNLLEFSIGQTQPFKGGVFFAFGCEFFITFLLMTVIMAVTTDYRSQGKMAGMAIGGVVFVAAYVFGPLSGASMNPARSIGPALVSLNFDYLWSYIVGPTFGALVAAYVYPLIQCLNSEAKEIKGCC